MNLINMVTLAYPSFYLNYYNGGASDQQTFGAQNNIYDGDPNTLFEYYVHHGGDGSVDGYIDFEVTWAQPKTIYNATAKGSIQMGGGNYFGARGSFVEFHFQLYYNNTWNSLYDYNQPKGNGTQDGDPPVNWNLNFTGVWPGVTGVRAYMHGFASSYEGDRNQYIWMYLNEVSCWREKYEELLRVHQSPTIAQPSGRLIRVGSQILNNHKMRINKNGTTMGIPLLNVADPEASAVRLYDGSGVKALALAD